MAKRTRCMPTHCGDNGRDMSIDIALSTLVNMMEVNRKDFVVIMSGVMTISSGSRELRLGYTQEMEKLFTSNPGLRSRIQFKVHFENYSKDELAQIGVNLFAQQNYELDETSQEKYEVNKRVSIDTADCAT